MNNYTVEYISGIVVSSQKHSQTHVYSEGGGGGITTGRNIVGDPVLRGKIEAPAVKSYVTTKHEIFLQLKDGREEQLVFPLDDIAVREGHYITLVVVFRTGLDGGYGTRLFNHHTRTLNNVLDRKTWRMLAQWPVPATVPSEKKQKPKQTGGLFTRAKAWLDEQKREIALGWEIGGNVNSIVDPTLPITQAELNRPLAIEFEQVVQAAVVELWEGRAEQY